jgi:hypothetical protein
MCKLCPRPRNTNSYSVALLLCTVCVSAEKLNGKRLSSLYNTMNKINAGVRCWNWVVFRSHFEIIPCTCPSPNSTRSHARFSDFNLSAERAPVFRPRAERLRSDPGRERVCMRCTRSLARSLAYPILCLLSSKRNVDRQQKSLGIETPGELRSAAINTQALIIMEIALQNDIFNSGQWNRLSGADYVCGADAESGGRKVILNCHVLRIGKSYA